MSEESLLNSPLAHRSSAPVGNATIDNNPLGKVTPIEDPAWQHPTDPLKSKDIKSQVQVIYREIPLVTVSTNWSVQDIRNALQSHVIGLFDESSQLVDAIVGDDRVQATMGSRTGGLLGRPIKFKKAIFEDSKKQKLADKCYDAFCKIWQTVGNEATLSELLQWSHMMGFGIGQLMWDTSGDIWIPYLKPWHPRYSYYHWTYHKYIAMTMDGQVAIEPGDATWVMHVPHGHYRGWMRGSVRAIAQPWLIRQYAMRDWARWSERHGLPIIKASTPIAADPNQVNQFQSQLSQLGQESVITLPKGVDAGLGYDLDLLEASDASWEGFQKLIAQCDMNITLALLHQNLTTEVKEGSYAAARIHGDVRQSALESDARALAYTIYQQISRPFAALNFGDPELAAYVDWDVQPPEDSSVIAATLDKVGDAILKFGKAGIGIKDLSKLFQKLDIPISSDNLEEIKRVESGGLGG